MTETIASLKSTQDTLMALNVLLRRQPLRLRQEKQAQMDLEEALTVAGLPFRREVELAEGDIIDFLVGPAGAVVGIEMKIKAPRRAIYRQLNRYAASDKLQALLLLTATPMGLPEAIQGKPAYVLSLGAAWL